MTLRTGHGSGAGAPRVEVLPANELPAPVPGEAAPLERRENGQVTINSGRQLGKRGGRNAHERKRLIATLGLAALADDAAFAPYKRTGDHFVTIHLTELAKQAGGVVGPAPSSIVVTSAIQMVASRFFSDKAMQTCDEALFTLASSLGNASRQNLLAAYELAVREATARQQSETKKTTRFFLPEKSK